jgi:hypothetical protein
VRKVSELSQRKELIIKTDEELAHKGVKEAYYELKKTWYWSGMGE